MRVQGRPPGALSLPVALLRSCRPEQWTKNLLVLAALVFARKFLEPAAVLKSILAFAVFCAASSAVYLLNDVRDAEADRQHPLKRFRPVASGELSPASALITAALLAILALFGGLLLQPMFGAVVTAYLVLQAAYSLGLKHLVVLDVMSVAAGFLLRAIGGAVVIEVEVSDWLAICAGLLALFLALAKRRHELVALENAGDHRRSLEHYSAGMLDQMIAAVTGATLLAYSLYTMAPRTLRELGTDNLKFTIPIVAYGLFRYLYLVYTKKEGGSPERHLVADKPLLTAVVLYGIACGYILVFHARGVSP